MTTSSSISSPTAPHSFMPRRASSPGTTDVSVSLLRKLREKAEKDVFGSKFLLLDCVKNNMPALICVNKVAWYAVRVLYYEQDTTDSPRLVMKKIKELYNKAEAVNFASELARSMLVDGADVALCGDSASDGSSPQKTCRSLSLDGSFCSPTKSQAAASFPSPAPPAAVAVTIPTKNTSNNNNSGRNGDVRLMTVEQLMEQFQFQRKEGIRSDATLSLLQDYVSALGSDDLTPLEFAKLHLKISDICLDLGMTRPCATHRACALQYMRSEECNVSDDELAAALYSLAVVLEEDDPNKALVLADESLMRTHNDSMKHVPMLYLLRHRLLKQLGRGENSKNVDMLVETALSLPAGVLGEVWKRGKINKAWKLRVFEVYNRILTFRELDSKEKKEDVLLGCLVGTNEAPTPDAKPELMQDDEPQQQQMYPYYYFHVQTRPWRGPRSRIFYCKVESRDKQLMWIQLFKACSTPKVESKP